MANGLEVGAKIYSDESNKHAGQLILAIGRVTKRTHDEHWEQLSKGPKETIQFLIMVANRGWQKEIKEIWGMLLDSARLPDKAIPECGMIKGCGEMAANRTLRNLSLCPLQSFFQSIEIFEQIVNCFAGQTEILSLAAGAMALR